MKSEIYNDQMKVILFFSKQVGSQKAAELASELSQRFNEIFVKYLPVEHIPAEVASLRPQQINALIILANQEETLSQVDSQALSKLEGTNVAFITPSKTVSAGNPSAIIAKSKKDLFNALANHWTKETVNIKNFKKPEAKPTPTSTHPPQMIVYYFNSNDQVFDNCMRELGNKYRQKGIQFRNIGSVNEIQVMRSPSPMMVVGVSGQDAGRVMPQLAHYPVRNNLITVLMNPSIPNPNWVNEFSVVATSPAQVEFELNNILARKFGGVNSEVVKNPKNVVKQSDLNKSMIWLLDGSPNFLKAINSLGIQQVSRVQMLKPNTLLSPYGVMIAPYQRYQQVMQYIALGQQPNLKCIFYGQNLHPDRTSLNHPNIDLVARNLDQIRDYLANRGVPMTPIDKMGKHGSYISILKEHQETSQPNPNPQSLVKPSTPISSLSNVNSSNNIPPPPLDNYHLAVYPVPSKQQKQTLTPAMNPKNQQFKKPNKEHPYEQPDQGINQETYKSPNFDNRPKENPNPIPGISVEQDPRTNDSVNPQMPIPLAKLFSLPNEVANAFNIAPNNIYYQSFQNLLMVRKNLIQAKKKLEQQGVEDEEHLKWMKTKEKYVAEINFIDCNIVRLVKLILNPQNDVSQDDIIIKKYQSEVIALQQFINQKDKEDILKKKKDIERQINSIKAGTNLKPSTQEFQNKKKSNLIMYLIKNYLGNDYNESGNISDVMGAKTYNPQDLQRLLQQKEQLRKICIYAKQLHELKGAEEITKNTQRKKKIEQVLEYWRSYGGIAKMNQPTEFRRQDINQVENSQASSATNSRANSRTNNFSKSKRMDKIRKNRHSEYGSQIARQASQINKEVSPAKRVQPARLDFCQVQKLTVYPEIAAAKQLQNIKNDNMSDEKSIETRSQISRVGNNPSDIKQQKYNRSIFQGIAYESGLQRQKSDMEPVKEEQNTGYNGILQNHQLITPKPPKSPTNMLGSQIAQPLQRHQSNPQQPLNLSHAYGQSSQSHELPKMIEQPQATQHHQTFPSTQMRHQSQNYLQPAVHQLPQMLQMAPIPSMSPQTNYSLIPQSKIAQQYSLPPIPPPSNAQNFQMAKYNTPRLHPTKQQYQIQQPQTIPESQGTQPYQMAPQTQIYPQMQNQSQIPPAINQLLPQDQQMQSFQIPPTPQISQPPQISQNPQISQQSKIQAQIPQSFFPQKPQMAPPHMLEQPQRSQQSQLPQYYQVIQQSQMQQPQKNQQPLQMHRQPEQLQRLIPQAQMPQQLQIQNDRSQFSQSTPWLPQAQYNSFKSVVPIPNHIVAKPINQQINLLQHSKSDPNIIAPRINSNQFNVRHQNGIQILSRRAKQQDNSVNDIQKAPANQYTKIPALPQAKASFQTSPSIGNSSGIPSAPRIQSNELRTVSTVPIVLPHEYQNSASNTVARQANFRSSNNMQDSSLKRSKSEKASTFKKQISRNKQAVIKNSKIDLIMYVCPYYNKNIKRDIQKIRTPNDFISYYTTEDQLKEMDMTLYDKVYVFLIDQKKPSPVMPGKAQIVRMNSLGNGPRDIVIKNINDLVERNTSKSGIHDRSSDVGAGMEDMHDDYDLIRNEFLDADDQLEKQHQAIQQEYFQMSKPKNIKGSSRSMLRKKRRQSEDQLLQESGDYKKLMIKLQDQQRKTPNTDALRQPKKGLATSIKQVYAGKSYYQTARPDQLKLKVFYSFDNPEIAKSLSNQKAQLVKYYDYNTLKKQAEENSEGLIIYILNNQLVSHIKELGEDYSFSKFLVYDTEPAEFDRSDPNIFETPTVEDIIKFVKSMTQ